MKHMKYVIGIIVLALIGGAVYVFVNNKKVEQDLKGVQSAGVSSTSSQTVTSSDAVNSSTTTAASSTVLTKDYVVKNLKFGFTGYGPGKQHDGTFSTLIASNVVVNSDDIPVSGTLTIDAKSVSTGIATLDKHLCSDDFFDCVKYPTITFTLVKAEVNKDGNYDVVGALDFHGVKKDVSFTVAQSGKSFSGDMLLDTTPFNFKYTGIKKDVRVTFSFSI